MDYEQIEGVSNIEQFRRSSLEPFNGADIERLESMENLSENNWRQMESPERLNALRNLETALADIQGREPRLVEMSNKVSDDICGFFDPNTNKITLNESLLDNRLDAISTVAHEGRHAYQFDAVRNPELHGDYSEVLRWQENWKNYNDANPTFLENFCYGSRVAQKLGFAKYWNQPIEVDARLYEENVKRIFC